MRQEKIKVIGFMTIHYAGDYLKEALLSIEPYVEKMVIAYSATPSHGYRSNNPCPDSRDYIFNTAFSVLGDKLIWDEKITYGNETKHRKQRYLYADGYDICLTIDSDEIYEAKDIESAIEYAYNGIEQYYGIDGYVNFFRSFEYACYDGFRPIRIENLKHNNGLQNLNTKLRVYHFSTAQREEIMRYKYSIFGHASEIKPNYLEDVFYRWSPDNNIGDLHPVSIGLWNAVKFDKEQLPDYLKLHKNYSKYII